MEFFRKRRALLVLCIAAMLGLFAVLVAESQAASVHAFSGYQGSRGQLDQALKDAQRQGYTEADLEPVTERLSTISGQSEPVWIGDRPGFYRTQSDALTRLRAALDEQERTVLARARTQDEQALAAARAEIDRDVQGGVDDPVLADFNGRYETMNKSLPGASRIADVRKIGTGAAQLAADAQKAGALQAAENAAIQQAADALYQQQNGNLEAIRAAGNAALASGRNEATIGAYEARPKRFAPIDQLMTVYNRIEKFGPRLGSADAHQAAFGAAAIQRYSAQVHDLVYSNLGAKHIVVNWTAQEAYAYEGQKQVMDTLVTTGIRGTDAYGTDFGPMKVLHADHPWTMHSPWPKGSPYWYPDTPVQWTVFFTWTGESFHDASWEPDSLLGPGSQFNSSTRSHGCVHLTYSLAHWLYGWADLGTPVDVVPGDGQPVAVQLSEMTTDDQGTPGSQTQH